jgi:hypothetical protein
VSFTAWKTSNWYSVFYHTWFTISGFIVGMGVSDSVGRLSLKYHRLWGHKPHYKLRIRFCGGNYFGYEYGLQLFACWWCKCLTNYSSDYIYSGVIFYVKNVFPKTSHNSRHIFTCVALFQICIIEIHVTVLCSYKLITAHN